MQFDLDLSSGKMSPECSAPKTTPLGVSWERLPDLVPPSFRVETSDGPTAVWLMDPSAGLPGEFSALNGMEWPNDASVCSLSQVLETGRIPQKYYLSARACNGILRRAEKRGKQLPALLARALQQVAGSERTSTSGGGYNLSPALTSSGRGVERTGESRGQDCVIPVLECGARTGKSTDDIRAGIGIGEDGDPMYTLQSGKQHGVFAFQERGRPEGSSVDISEEVTAPNGGGRRQELNVCIPSTGDISHCLNAGGMGRIDYETETLVTHSLTGNGFDASEDGTGRRTPLVPVVFDPNQVTSKANRSNPQPGDPSHPLPAQANSPLIVTAYRTNAAGQVDDQGEVTAALTTQTDQCTQFIAFSCKDSGADAGDISPTLRAMEFDGSHANGGGQVAVAVALRGREGGATAELGDEVNGSLRAGGGGGGDKAHVLTNMAVRRLTPLECCRLQSFSDDYLDIQFHGKPAADGNKYKALGNSMCVNVVRWIGDRLRTQ